MLVLDNWDLKFSDGKFFVTGEVVANDIMIEMGSLGGNIYSSNEIINIDFKEKTMATDKNLNKIELKTIKGIS
ncbi:MAG: hypothetical protein K0U78_15405 [Actinomycetia bacterium]|nr:hypothetical protein [Actinomycetes bacterium]